MKGQDLQLRTILYMAELIMNNTQEQWLYTMGLIESLRYPDARGLAIIRCGNPT